MTLSLDQLVRIMPRLSPVRGQAYLENLTRAMVEFEISSPARASAFLAQLAHESGELRYWEELADGSAYEPTSQDPGAVRRARRLGNTQPGDGARFKGRGLIQLTGRFNYARASKALGTDLVGYPILAASPDYGFRIAAWFFQDIAGNELADIGAYIDISRKVNGGLNGLKERERYWAVAKKVLGVRS